MKPNFVAPPLLWQAATAGVLLGVSFLHPWAWWLVFAGAWLLLYTLARARTAQQAAGLAFLAGVVKYGIALGWFWSVFPLANVGSVSPAVQLGLIGVSWAHSALALASGVAGFGYVYRRVLTGWPDTPRVVVTGLAWGAGEIGGALLFSLTTLGVGSSIQPYFSFGHSGYALVPHHGFLIVGGLVGVYGLSFIVGLCAELCRVWARRARTRFVFALFGFFLVTAALPLSLFAPSPQPHGENTVFLVETNWAIAGSRHAPSSAQRQEAFFAMFDAIGERPAFAVVLPEDARFTAGYAHAAAARRALRARLPHTRFVLDSGRYVRTSGDVVLRAFVHDLREDETYRLDKQYLVPQGEYIPFLYEGINAALAPAGATRAVLHDARYVPGVPRTSVHTPPAMPEVLFCFEGVVPYAALARVLAYPSTPFVAHSVSHSWFHGEPHGLWHQLDAMLQLHARQSGVAILQAANQAPAKHYRADGSMAAPSFFAASTGWRLYKVQPE